MSVSDSARGSAAPSIRSNATVILPTVSGAVLVMSSKALNRTVRIMRNPLKHCQLSRFRNFREIGDTPQK
jgi:hypothetical protein